MSNYRRRNFVVDAAPPGPVPRTPVIKSLTPGDTTAALEWDYPTNAIEVDHWDVEVFQGAALLGTLRVEGPSTRSHTLGELTNGIEYGVKMQAVNFNGHSDSSNKLTVIPKSLQIPKPTVTTVIGWDGFATFSFTCDTPPAEITAVHYVVKREDSGFEFEGVATMSTQRAGNTGPIDNDREYRLYLALEVNGSVGPYSDPSKVFQPTNPVPPFPPVWVHIDVDKTGTKASGSTTWKLTVSKGARNDASPTDITGFRYVIEEKTTRTLIAAGTKPTSFSPVDITITAAPWCEGVVLMNLWAFNKDGESAPTVIDFDTEPHGELPLDFGVFEELGGYRYHYAQDDVKALAKVNKRGIGLNLDVMVIGAGGAGSGRTTIGGLGGNGGSGEAIVTTVKPFTTGTITCKIGDGAQYSGTAPGGYSYVTIVDGNQILARGGGNAVGKTDGTPSYLSPCKDVAELMPGAEKLRIWVWNTPRSQQVGGAHVWDKNNAPNGDLYAEAGGGTNSGGSNHGGNGGPGVVVVRYKIADVPAAEPLLTRRQAWRWRRLERKHARQMEKAI